MLVNSSSMPWCQAETAPFEAFGILYYPLFANRADLACDELDDADMAWAVTANANLDGTGYTLSHASITVLAAYHHVMAGIAADTWFLPLASGLDAGGINPFDDIKRLVPDVTAVPMYPDFPEQVMEISEARYRYHQGMHYLSTYGVELVAGLLGLDVKVGESWLPDVEFTPKEREDETLVAPKVLHVVLTVEDLRSIVSSRLERATRMHPAEIASTLLVFQGLGDEEPEVSFPRIAFHENMLELVRMAGQGSSSQLERVAFGLAQHPGDLLKATMHLVRTNPRQHLSTRQKKGLCRAFERFPVMSIARNIADAGSDVREAPNFLSVARFGGANLRTAVDLVEAGKVRPWASELESLWAAVNGIADADAQKSRGIQGFFAQILEMPEEPAVELEAAWQALLSHYGYRPGLLFRSFARLIKAGCPDELLLSKAREHVRSYSIPTIVRTLTTVSERDVSVRLDNHGRIAMEIVGEEDRAVRRRLCALLRELLFSRLAKIETPLRGKRVFLDTAGISLKGSLLVPNETGNTGTAWPPAGIAWELPADKTIRFFTFWNHPGNRVDVDLHFFGCAVDGSDIHIGWNTDFKGKGLVMSGDITHSVNAVEFLDADMAAARRAGVHFIVQRQHIFGGARNWKDIETCFSGAVIVGNTSRNVLLADPKNIIFRDDLTGSGTVQDYAVVNVQSSYVRLLRGAEIPLGDVDFCLGDYLEILFQAQDATIVANPADADVRVCVGRSDEADVVSLFDEGFYVC